MGGVMVSAFDESRRLNVSVFSQADGSFRIDKLQEADFRIRARLPGQRDHWVEKVKLGDGTLSISMQQAKGKELEEQAATSAFSQIRRPGRAELQDDVQLLPTRSAPSASVPRRNRSTGRP